ncbi:divalent metal cation transporter, partial [Mesorhizobium sp. M2D.F.Ca.ET.145.01.1.1]
MSEADVTAPRSAWRFAKREEDDQPSLREVNSSVAVPSSGVGFRRLFAFMGPGYMVSVGYMDPG